ncbi:hypothetical protein [Microbacterium enclense]|uniref:hypothetical protein n=1 Tax=Microbacterium enclense TaxID=993073 RepID=UPI001428996B|nr:hypothetical protein [Microbacterium enclense]
MIFDAVHLRVGPCAEVDRDHISRVDERHPHGLRCPAERTRDVDPGVFVFRLRHPDIERPVIVDRFVVLDGRFVRVKDLDVLIYGCGRRTDLDGVQRSDEVGVHRVPLKQLASTAERAQPSSPHLGDDGVAAGARVVNRLSGFTRCGGGDVGHFLLQR